MTLCTDRPSVPSVQTITQSVECLSAVSLKARFYSQDAVCRMLVMNVQKSVMAFLFGQGNLKFQVFLMDARDHGL